MVENGVAARREVEVGAVSVSEVEVLRGLSAGDQVVGVTFECDPPAEARERRLDLPEQRLRLRAQQATPGERKNEDLDQLDAAGQPLDVGVATTFGRPTVAFYLDCVVV